MQKIISFIILFGLLFHPLTPVLSGEDPVRFSQSSADEIYRLAQEMVHHGGEGHTDEIVQYGEKVVERIETNIKQIHGSPIDKKTKEEIIASLRLILKKTEEAIREGRNSKAKAALSAAKDAFFQAKKSRQMIHAISKSLAP